MNVWMVVLSSQLVIFGSIKKMLSKSLLNKEMNDVENHWSEYL